MDSHEWLSGELDLKRLTALLVAVLVSAALLVHAQQRQTAAKTRVVEQGVQLGVQQAVQHMEKAPALNPALLVGLTKPQVEARIGKPSAGFATVWNYKQPKGTLHVRFGRDGIVSDAKIDVEPRSSGRG